MLGTENFDDCRGYGIIRKILTNLGLSKNEIILITESEKKISALKENGLNIIKYTDYLKNDINRDNISEYLIKILNCTHNFDENTIDKIVELIEEKKYNGRTLSTLISIIDRINKDDEYLLEEKFKKKLLKAYDSIICGIEKKYIMGDSSVVKVKNAFSCKVNSSIFKAIQNIYDKNIFDRISLEKLYYFENKFENQSIRVRTSKVLDTVKEKSIFIKGQMHLEQRVFNAEKTQIVQNEISRSKLKSYFENNNYDYVKRVEMITIISEGQIPGINIYIKKIPNIENRVMDIYGKKEDIKQFIKLLSGQLSRNVLNEVVSNTDYEDENFTDYNLRFADLDDAVQEELELYELLNNGGN